MKTMKRIVMVIMVITMMLTLANPAAVDAAQKVKLNKKKVTLTITDKKKNPAVTLKVKNTSKKAKWTTSNKKVATVKKGKVTAKGAGKATITCKVDRKKLTCKVTVKDKRKSRGTTVTEDVTEECTSWETHNWKKHWAVYETEASVDLEYLANGGYAAICNCGIFLSEAEKMAHLPKYDPNSMQNLVGLHAYDAKLTYTTETINGVMYFKLHTDYVDYMTCTKCGEHVVATDLPK